MPPLPNRRGDAEPPLGRLAEALDSRGVELEPAKARVIDGGVPPRETPAAADVDKNLRAALMTKLDLLFQIPGLNRPEIELLRPLGMLERFLAADSGAGSGAGSAREKIQAEAGALARNLLSDDPERVEQALRDLPRREPAVLREAASRLSRMEADLIRSEPSLNRLSDAAGSLRDLGRQLLAVKAENLAGQDRNPGVMLAEVPFKLADNAGDGRMQMFYRRSKGGRDGGWTSRVILDLNTTGMGPVLGDMRFFGSDMILNMFVEKRETADFLGGAADELADGLHAKGFRLKSRFMVLPPPPAPPEIQAQRPEIAGAADAGGTPPPVPGDTKRRGRLDVKG